MSTAKARDLPGPVIVGGTTLRGQGRRPSWMFHDDKSLNCRHMHPAGFLPEDHPCLLL